MYCLNEVGRAGDRRFLGAESEAGCPLLIGKLCFGGVGIMLYLCGMITRLFFGGPTLITPTSTLDRSTTRQIVKLATEWCVQNFGVNNRRSKPFSVSIRKQTSGSPCYGQFCHETNTISVFTNNCHNVRLLVQTLIHEYTHYMQPIRGSYYKLLDEYGYEQHPMEVEAREMEAYYKDCWKYIKKKI